MYVMRTRKTDMGVHLVGLYEVEVLPIGTVAILKVTALLLTPATKLFWNNFYIEINLLYILGDGCMDFIFWLPTK